MGEEKYACSHLGIFTNHPEKLIDFYSTVLGFQKKKEGILSRELMESLFGIPAECRLVLMERAGAGIEIFSSKEITFEERRSSLSGFNHWGLVVEDKEAFCREAEKSAEVLKAYKNGKIIYFLKDPDGNRIEVQS